MLKYLFLLLLVPPLTPAWGQRELSAIEDTELQMIRAGIIQYSRQFVGVRYCYAGRSPVTGFDCSGFTHFILSEFHILVSPSSGRQAQQGRLVYLPDAQPGDLLVFGTDSTIQHVAMLVQQNDESITCIHSTSTYGVIEENILNSSYWMSRLLYVRDVVTEAMVR